VDLPMGLTEKEIDQFLREQRLEDLHRKIQAHELEDMDPDIRAPSPPPVYDKAGNRLNTRDMRIRKAMTAEYNRLIRYMIKHVDGYLPPVDWKPAKLLKKIIIPIEKFPQAPFMGVIIGPRGVNHKRLQETTGCKIFIRGRDIGDKWQSDEEAAMPQHVHIEGDTEEQILSAERLIEPLLNPESPEFEYARTHGMQQLAMVNGFTLNKAEQRCGICGALGHLGFECPETNNQNYKMANVTCTICGDKGHVASDCKKAAEAHKRDNVDWKAMAEKKAQMDKDYGDMMGDLSGAQPSGVTPGAGASAMVPTSMPGAAAAAGGAVDKSILCPGGLIGKLIGPGGATIKKLATDSGAQINLDTVAQPGGAKTIIITAADPVARERAKMHVQMWIKENQVGGPPSFATPANPGMQPMGAGGWMQPQGQPGLRPVAPMGAGGLAGNPGMGMPGGAIPKPGGMPNMPLPGMRPPMGGPGGQFGNIRPGGMPNMGTMGPPGGVPNMIPPGVQPAGGMQPKMGMMQPGMRPPQYGGSNTGQYGGNQGY